MAVASCLSLVSIYGSYLRYCLSSAGLSSQTIEIDDETTIHFWGPKKASPSDDNKRPPLVLIHGFGPSAVWQWRQQAVFFARDFDVYMPDLVFFGQSTTKSNERSEVFQAQCVAKLLEKIGVRRKYSIVGTSYGGMVAYQMASMWPERVERVVIASSGVNLTKKDNEELLKRAGGGTEKIEDLMLPETPRKLRTLMALSVYRCPYTPDFILSDFIQKIYSENRKEKKELLRGLRTGQNERANITPLPQEVLIVWGEKDQIFQLDKAIELNKLLGENARLEVMKNTSHVPQIENAAQFNNIVKTFLSGIL